MARTDIKSYDEYKAYSMETALDALTGARNATMRQAFDYIARLGAAYGYDEVDRFKAGEPLTGTESIEGTNTFDDYKNMETYVSNSVFLGILEGKPLKDIVLHACEVAACYGIDAANKKLPRKA